MMAAQEYEGMKEQLDLEQNLRVKAESYAHEVKEQSQKYGAFKVQVTRVTHAAVVQLVGQSPMKPKAGGLTPRSPKIHGHEFDSSVGN